MTLGLWLANSLELKSHDTALGEQIFNVSETQAETKVEPDGMGDDVGRESISVVARRRSRHPVTLIRWTST